MTWLKRVRGAVGTGVTWALLWVPVAIVVGTQIIDPTDAMDEMWWMVGAIPGFLSGIIFSAVLSSMAHRRRLDELSIVRVGGWGAIAGVLTGILPFLLGDRGGEPIWPLALTVIPIITLLSALSAAGSLALAQRAKKSEAAGADFSSDQMIAPLDAPLGIRAGNSQLDNFAEARSTVKNDSSLH